MKIVMSILAKYDKYNGIILAGGINDIPKLSYPPCIHARLQYSSAERTINYASREMRSSVERVSSITDSPVVKASVPGIDLYKYTPLLHKNLYHLQAISHTAITGINRQFRA